jgi:excinuclease ABC subunit C
MIPKDIKIKKKKLPDTPGVYFYFDKKGLLLYIGKATSLKRRVGSYFTKAHDNRIGEMVSQISKIDYIETPSVIEALVLEANQIKAKKPKYNILQRDDKTFLYLVITNDVYPRPVLMRGHELSRLGVDPFKTELSEKAKKKFIRIFGPYTSSTSLKKALDLIRRMIPWSDCLPPEETGRKRQCFNAHLRKCPGVCSGKITPKEYKKIVRQLIMFFDGKKKLLIKQFKKEMLAASKDQRYEDAAKYKRNMFAFEHIRDIALISKEDYELPLNRTDSESIIDLHGRIEAYDISNISGTSAVGSMVVFEETKPAKSLYRKFKIKTVKGANDVAMLEEVMTRRLRRFQLYPNKWPLPEIMIIDGGKPQVNRIQKVLNEFKVTTPIIGIAKGFDRKQDQLIYDRQDRELARVAKRGKEVFQKARDESHRFAIKYHRKVRSKKLINK